MKNNDSDKLLRDKLTSLDTLSGGIVYGREEAWEKLQERLERKPAKKIQLQYWLASAAILLLFVSVWVGNKQSGEQVAAINNKVIHNETVASAKVAKTEPATTTENEKRIIRNISAVIKRNKPVKETVKNKVEIIIADAPQAPVERQKSDELIVSNTSPVTPVTMAPMKVVHNNEIGSLNQAIEETGETISANDAIAISKLPVAHINDVVREVNEIKEIRRGNRLVFRTNGLYHDRYSDNNFSTNSAANYQQPFFLKSIFNNQN